MPGVVYAITAKNNIITAVTGDNIALGTANHSVIAGTTTDPLKTNAPLVINLRFDIKSRYFQAVAHAQIGDASAVAVATLDRGPADYSPKPTLKPIGR